METTVDEEHLSAHDIATYVDRRASEDRRSRIVAHLARCADCRDEVADVSRVVAAPVRGSGPLRRVLVPTAAAAAVMLAWVGAARMTQPGAPIHRDESITLTAAPRLHAPVGEATGAPTFAWTPVAYADRYRVRLYDREGVVLWEHEGADTAVSPPASLALGSGTTYFWRVEARTGFERWAASDLVEFELRPAPPR